MRSRNWNAAAPITIRALSTCVGLALAGHACIAPNALGQTGADPGTTPGATTPGAMEAIQPIAPKNQPGSDGKVEHAAFADHAWCIAQVVSSARWPVRTDGVEALMAAGDWPHRDDAAHDAESTTPPPSVNGREWQRVDTPNGVIPGSAFAGGYARVVLQRAQAGPVLLRASGHSMVYINGKPHAGDPYGYGYLLVPVNMQEGANEFLFASGRGDMRYALEEVEPGLSIVLEDATLPDAIGMDPVWIGVTVINTTNQAINASPGNSVTIRASATTGAATATRSTPIGSVEAMSARKVGFEVGLSLPEVADGGEPVAIRVEIGIEGQEPLDVETVTLRVPPKGGSRVLTYISDVDGSVQKYAVVPAVASNDASDDARPGLVLSLHGASVEALNQANAYEAKKDFVIVAPTNRRPFGFDWEDWGRRDALDVLAIAQKQFGTDPSRVYVTGHSMGGHGTWQMVSLFPDRFAVAAPSAGWESFESYAGWMPRLEPGTGGAQVANVFRRAAATSQTALLKENLRDKPLYILHGDADDNVPVSQARMMRELLTGIASPIAYHEQPGAGHWWDDDQGPGAACLDWPGFFEMFRAHTLAPSDDVSSISFTTLDPSVSARRNWIRITQQERVGEASTINATHDGSTIVVTTTNVAAFEVTLAGFEGSVIVDGDELRGSGFLRRSDAGGEQPRWRAGFVPASERSPSRGGPFKRAFDRRAVLVYGTQGTPGEREWARAKALFDAQTFAYRGNGGFEVMSDVAYLETLALPLKPDTKGHIWPLSDRNVVLYGNRDTNALWARYVGADAPLDVARGTITARSASGESRVIEGDDLVCIAIVPGPGRTLAGLVAPTGAPGGVVANRLPFFLSGAGFPDYLVLDARMLGDLPGRGTGGVVGAGFFNREWRIPSFTDESGVWRDAATK